MQRLQRDKNAMKQVVHLFCAALFATSLVGCAHTPKAMGIPWWPQGPGDAAGDSRRAADARPGDVGHESLSPPAQPNDREANAVRHGDLIFISGQVAAHRAPPRNIEADVRGAMDNVVRILASHGLTISNIVSVTLYMQDITDLPRADAIYASYFRRSLPPRSVVDVDKLPNGGLVEIAVIAGR